MPHQLKARWSVVLMATIALTRIGMGLFYGLSGPTLLYLRDNVNTSVSTLSYMFSGRSFGVLLGSVVGGVIKKRTKKNFRHLLPLGAGIAVLGIVTLIVPWIRNFALLVIDASIGGIMFGYTDAGLQALILQEWGEKGSRSHIQIFHFMYCVGAFIAPIIAKPFLVMSDQQRAASGSCPDEYTIWKNATTPSPLKSTFAVPLDLSLDKGVEFNPVGWAYTISGIWMLLTGCLNIALALYNIEAKVSEAVEKKGYISEQRKEEPIRDVIWVFIPVVMYYFCSVATEFVFYNFIYAVSLCSNLQFSVTNASYMTSITWLGFCVGRFIGIFAAAYLKPRTIIVFSILGSIVDSALMSLFGETSPWLAWIVSFSHGFTPSLLYSSGVSWLSQITNVSGLYMFVFGIGGAFGPLAMMPLAGYVFDSNPFNVMYLVLVISTLNAVFYAIALLAGRRHLKFLKGRHLSEGIGCNGYD